MRITKTTLAAALILGTLMPALASAQTASFYYPFNSAGTLHEASSSDKSSSPYFWLKSGAKLVIEGGVGKTVQGDLPANDPWRKVYASRLSVPTDQGAHPQNVFLLLSKAGYKNTSAQAYIRRGAGNIDNAANRQPYNGESILARYQNSSTYYYASIRADGAVTIKKKLNGAHQTLSYKKVLPGTYSATANPDLIPANTWIGLKLTVEDTADGTRLTLSTDIGKTGAWSQALSVIDDPAKFGSAIAGTGAVGIQSDYADAQFDDFRFSELGTASAPAPAPAPTPTPTPAPAPAPTKDYDAAVLSGKPVMYLAMDSSGTGKEPDLSGHNNAGTYKGGTPATAALPNGETAASFNGSSQYVTVPSSASLSIPTTGKLTWEAWIRPDTFQFPYDSSDGYVDWMGKCANYSPTCEWEARLYGASTPQNRPNRLSAYAFNPSAGLGSAADWQPQAGLLKAGQWLHVVAEYDLSTTPSGCSSAYPGSINIWVNGIKQNFAAHAPTGCMSQYKISPKAGSSPLTIGTMALDTWFKGAVGKVAVYDRLLTQTEINAHFTAMTGAQPSGSCASACTAALVQ
jgi:hypothetical protein